MPQKRTSIFLKREYQVIYAIVLIILIPSTIIFNTIWSINSFKDNIDIELQRHALAVGRLFNKSVYQETDNFDDLQTKLQTITKAESQLYAFDVLVPEGDNFKVVASLYPTNIDNIVEDLNYVISWHQNEAVATLVSDFATVESTEKERFWEIVMPLSNKEGGKEGLLSLRMSLRVMDDLVRSSLTKSYLMLSITVLIVMLLLALNTRLFEHAILFRKLKEVDKMKDEFISIASHELRTPITTIKGFLSMILEGDYGSLNEDGKKGLKIMEASVNRLTHLVEDLLSVSRIEQKRLQLDLQAVNTEEVLDSIVAEFEFKIKEKGLQFHLTKAKDLPKVFADEDKLRQALINLVGNSIKYTKQGQVDILAKVVDDKSVTITIKDTGIGMSAEESQNLFEKFYRIKSEDTQGIIGTGLGLWITKQLVELMGGKIFVESIKHVGTQIYFTIPIFDPNKHTPTRPEPNKKTV